MTDLSKTNTENHQELLPIVIDSIKKIARSYKKQSLTIQTTEIVHESYLKLIKEGSKRWADENAYLAAFAVTIRRYLIDRYRQKTAEKRGGNFNDLNIDDIVIEFPAPEGFSDWLDLDKKLSKLEQIDPLAAEVVQLKFFVGLTTKEIAKVINKDSRTVSRKWQFAKAWLKSHLSQ